MKYKIFLILGLILAMSTAAQAKQADLAGTWYPGTSKALKKEIDTYIEEATPDEPRGKIFGAVVPHAGIRFSGPIAAYSYKTLQKVDPDTVVLVGFTHNAIEPGTIAIFTDEYYVTPLGKFYVNRVITDRIKKYSTDIRQLPSAFDSENSIELQIPFIQATLGDVKVVILAICDQSIATCRLLSDALTETLKDEKNCVLISSSDMSHYKPYTEANRKDIETVNLLEKMDPDEFYFESLKSFHDCMCGYGALYTVMRTCKNFGADTMQVLAYANSGDTFGKKEKVVGYLSAIFVEESEMSKTVAPSKEKETFKSKKNNTKEEPGMLDKDLKIILLEIARDSIKYYLETGMRLDVKVQEDKLKENMGAFVTLHKDGYLRGCIGNMVGTRPLYLTIRDMAIAAAVSDPRFHKVTEDEMKDIDIEISVLSPMVQIEDHNLIEMGKHGVMVKSGGASGVYLPQVATETGWTKEEFMNSLCTQKAGVSEDCWKTGDCDMYIFEAEVFGEKDFESNL